MIGKLSREASAMRQAELWDRSTPVVVKVQTPAPHIHDRQRSDRKRRRYGIPVKAHDVRCQIHLPPPGYLAWSLLARVVAPK